MKSLALFALILSVSLASFASGQALHFSTGDFDSKHFSGAKKTSATFEMNATRSQAFLKVTENSCLTSSQCQDLETTRLNQTFDLRQVSVDACHVKTFKGTLKPSGRAVSSLGHAPLLMAEIEILDASESSCGSFPLTQVKLTTRSSSSVGVSILNFHKSLPELSQTDSAKTRVQSLLFKGESSLGTGI